MKKSGYLWLVCGALLVFSGCRPASKGELWGCVDQTGQYVKGPQIGTSYEHFSCPVISNPTVSRYSSAGVFEGNSRFLDIPNYDRAFYVWPDDRFIIIERQMTADERKTSNIKDDFFAKKIGVLDEKGNIVVEPEYNSFKPAQCHVMGLEDRVNGGYLLIDLQSGTILSRPRQQYGDFIITTFNSCEGGLIPVNGKNLYSGEYETRYLDKKGKLFTTPPAGWDATFIAGKNIDAARFSGKWGYIDHENGTILITPKYDEVQQFDEGKASVKLNDLWGVIDLNGHMLISPKFTQISFFREDYAAVELNGKWGFINGNGQIVVYPQWEQVKHYSEGYAAVNRGKYWGFVNARGEIVIRPKYLFVEEFENGAAVVILDPDSVSIFNSSIPWSTFGT